MSSTPHLSHRRFHGNRTSWTRPSWKIRLGIGILAGLCLLGGSLTEVKRGDSVQAADEPRPPATSPATSPNAPAPSQGAVDEEYFEKKVRPILVERCQKCHNSQKAKGGLHLDSRAGFLRGGDSGPALNLLPQVLQYEGDIRMPPQGKLPQTELDILLRWLAAGAPWPQDRNPSTTPSPSTPHPLTPARTHWAFQPLQRPSVPSIPAGTPSQNPIDTFVLARLQAVGLNLAPEADKATLLRRLYFDLIGLPPSPEELDAFLNDAHPDAYDRVVDRLLASPHYGERWARHWLDLVRYAETYGHEFDFDIPEAWRYRDYVIRAFNADLPYDRFLREQIAGDLLDEPRYDPQTGSNESLLATAFWWLGDAVHSPVDSRMDFADRMDNQIDVFGKAILGLTLGCARCHDHKFDPIPSRDYYALFGILASSRFHYGDIGDPRPLERLLDELTRSRPQEHSTEAESRGSGGDIIPPPRPGSAWRLGAKAWEHFGADWRQRWDAAGLGLRPTSGEGFPHSGREAEALSAALRSPTFIIEQRYLMLRVAGRQAQARVILNGLQLIRDPIYGGLAKRIDHGEEFRWLVFDLHLWPGQPAYVELLDDGPGYFAVREAWFADTPPPAETGESVPCPPSAAREEDPHRRRSLEALEAACRNRPRAPVMRDGPGRNERLFIRGNPRQLGPEVPRGFLSLFPAPPVTSSGSGRRELANAVLGPARPLVARVFVNRLWQHHFGRGLVATSDDFGAHGEAPTHPELLDWLAEQFIASGWSIKHMRNWPGASTRTITSCTARICDVWKRKSCETPSWLYPAVWIAAWEVRRCCLTSVSSRSGAAGRLLDHSMVRGAAASISRCAGISSPHFSPPSIIPRRLPPWVAAVSPMSPRRPSCCGTIPSSTSKLAIGPNGCTANNPRLHQNNACNRCTLPPSPAVPIQRKCKLPATSSSNSPPQNPSPLGPNWAMCCSSLSREQ